MLFRSDDLFDEIVQDLYKGLNELAREGAPIEVSYVDLDDDGSVDEYHLLFVGPTPEAIIKAQRDLLIKEVIDLMERHFDVVELKGVVTEVSRLFEERLKMQDELPMHKTLWTGTPFSGLCEPAKKCLH